MQPTSADMSGLAFAARAILCACSYRYAALASISSVPTCFVNKQVWSTEQGLGAILKDTALGM